MTKPMTPEDLREKLARKHAELPGYYDWDELSDADRAVYLADADEFIPTFLQFCDERKYTGLDIAKVCGKFSRLQDESKKPIGLHTLADMAALMQFRKIKDSLSSLFEEER